MLAKITTLKKKNVDPGEKALIVFDLDGTLAESKAKMDAGMARLIAQLLTKKKVAVIGGGKYELFKHQFVSELRAPKALLKDLFLFPTTASRFYRFERGRWREVYVHTLQDATRKKIIRTFNRVFRELGYTHPPKVYGDLIEDRGTQVTFSALGQKAPVAAKEEWTRQNKAMKIRIAKRMQRYLPKLAVRAAGYTSIDVTKKGIDKAYGIRQIEKYLKVPKKKMLFIGDSLFPGGNDHAALKSGVDCVAVRGPADTKKIIRMILEAERR